MATQCTPIDGYGVQVASLMFADWRVERDTYRRVCDKTRVHERCSEVRRV
jgi:hypothetical protein